MGSEGWDKDEIRRVAESSGKPLEVEVASAFQSIWTQDPSLSPKISLGSYFVDPASDKYRELDVLIEWVGRPEYLNKPIDQRLLVLCSCKGFPSGMAPITYSLPNDCGPDYSEPTFACS